MKVSLDDGKTWVDASTVSVIQMNNIESLVRRFYDFKKILAKTSKYNVPQMVLADMVRDILRMAFNFKTTEIPDTANGWKIYGWGKEADELAKELHDSMKQVLTAVDSLTIADVKSRDLRLGFGCFLGV
jgi:hypothetical protein